MCVAGFKVVNGVVDEKAYGKNIFKKDLGPLLSMTLTPGGQDVRRVLTSELDSERSPSSMCLRELHAVETAK